MAFLNAIKYIVWTGVVLTLFGAQVRGSGKHLICKDVEDVFASPNYEPTSGTTGHSLQGPPGKHGVPGSRGIRGLPGPQGPPGTVDREMMSAAAREALQPANDAQMAVIKELNLTLVAKIEEYAADLKSGYEGEISRLNAAIVKLEGAQRHMYLCGVLYAGKCFYAIQYPRSNVTYTIAEKLCADEGANPANIYSSSHYEAIMNYLRSLRSGSFYVWLGMKIKPSTGDVSLFNGSPTTFKQWYPDHPETTKTNTVVELAIDDPSVARQGMFNHQDPASSSPLNGVLCEK